MDEFRRSCADLSAFGEELKDEDLERDGAGYSCSTGSRRVGRRSSRRRHGVVRAFELTVPGGRRAEQRASPRVGVLPSHRRRGILRELIVRQLERRPPRGEPVAILWASESLIYGRFGYGIAAPQTAIDAERSAFAFRDDPGPRGSCVSSRRTRLQRLFPPLYDSCRL